MGHLGSFFAKSKKINNFPNYYFLGLFFQTSDGLGITFKDLILFFKKKSFLAHRGSFLKNQKMTLSPLFFTIFNYFFKLLNCDYYFFKILVKKLGKTRFLACRGSFLKFFDFSKKTPYGPKK